MYLLYEGDATSFTANVLINDDCSVQIADVRLPNSLEKVESQTLLITKRLDIAAAEEEKDNGAKNVKMSGFSMLLLNLVISPQAEWLLTINSNFETRRLKLRKK